MSDLAEILEIQHAKESEYREALVRMANLLASEKQDHHLFLFLRDICKEALK